MKKNQFLLIMKFILLLECFWIRKKNQITFIFDNGFFILDLVNNKINNVINQHDTTSLCSFLLNDNIIIIDVYNKIFIYFISENKFEKFFFDEELIFGKELSENKLY